MLEYYKDDETRLRDELICFKVMLRRARRIPEDETLDLLERIRMLDPLLEEDPWIQELQQKSLTQGELKRTRAMLSKLVRLRFPALVAFAESQTACIEHVEVLDTLFGQLVICGDEQAACNALRAVGPATDAADL